jgi:hypothetical protein
MRNDREEGVGKVDKLAAAIGMSHHTHECLYMLPSVVFVIIKVSWQHLRPVSIFFL